MKKTILDNATLALDEALKRERACALKGLREGAKRFPNVYKDALAHAAVIYIGDKRLVVTYIKYGAITHRCHLESRQTSNEHKGMFSLLEHYLSNPEDIPKFLAEMQVKQKSFTSGLLMVEALKHHLAGESMFSSTL